MLPDPQEVASCIAARIELRDKITKKHRNIYIVLAVILWILFATFLTLMTVAFLAEPGNDAHKWAFLICFILVSIVAIIATFLAISLQSDGERFSTIYNWYFQHVLNHTEIPITKFENISTLNNESRRSSDAHSASTVAIDDIRFQEIRNILVDDLRRQFSQNKNTLEPAVLNIDRETPQQEAVDINISCAQPSSSSESISSKVSSQLLSTVPSDPSLSGPRLLEGQTSFNEILEMTADNPDIDVCTSGEYLENIQQQSSAIESRKPDVVLPEQDSDLESQETDSEKLSRMKISPGEE